MWQVQMELIPNVSNIWVAKLYPQDPIYEYESELEAQQKAQELKASDATGRNYRVVPTSSM